MGSIVVVASSKGGVSKTTNSTLLAVCLAAQGYKVAAVDADRNQALATWHKMAEAPPLTCSVCIDHNEIVGHVIAQAESNDVVVVDTAGFENQTAIFAMGAADLVLIPVMADRNSVIEARKTARQVESVGKLSRRSIPFRVLLSRWNPRGIAEKATLEDLEAARLPRIQQFVPQLAALQKATFSGSMPVSGPVAVQMDRVIDEIRSLGGVGAKGEVA